MSTSTLRWRSPKPVLPYTLQQAGAPPQADRQSRSRLLLVAHQRGVPTARLRHELLVCACSTARITRRPGVRTAAPEQCTCASTWNLCVHRQSLPNCCYQATTRGQQNGKAGASRLAAGGVERMFVGDAVSAKHEEASCIMLSAGRTLLQDGAVLHHRDAGGVADGGQAVGHDDGRPLPRRRVQRHLHATPAFWYPVTTCGHPQDPAHPSSRCACRTAHKGHWRLDTADQVGRMPQTPKPLTLTCTVASLSASSALVASSSSRMRGFCGGQAVRSGQQRHDTLCQHQPELQRTLAGPALQQRSHLHQRARDGDALLLTARQLDAALPHLHGNDKYTQLDMLSLCTCKAALRKSCRHTPSCNARCSHLDAAAYAQCCSCNSTQLKGVVGASSL